MDRNTQESPGLAKLSTPMPPQTPMPSLSPEAARALKKVLGANATEVIPALQILVETFPHFKNKTDTA